jgi:heavy metal efflux system protein
MRIEADLSSLERFIRSAIRHRWLVLLLTLALIGLGGWSFAQLPIDATPDITNVQVQINTEAPGYSPLEAEQRITFSIESALSGIPKLDYTRSLSRYGLSQVTVVFKDGTDIYFARQQVAERIAHAKSQLPAGIEPELGPIATGLGEIFLYTVVSDPDARQADGRPWNPTELRTLNDWVVRPQLRRVPGVTEVNSIGGYSRQILVAPDPAKLLAHDISLAAVVTAVEKNNQNVGAGYIERNGRQLLVRIPNQASDLEALRDIVLNRRDGVPIRVRDVATEPSFERARRLKTARKWCWEPCSCWSARTAEQFRAQPPPKCRRFRRVCLAEFRYRPFTIAPGWSIARSIPSKRTCSKAPPS